MVMCVMSGFWTFFLYLVVSNIIFTIVFTQVTNKMEVIAVKFSFDILFLSIIILLFNMFSGVC